MTGSPVPTITCGSRIRSQPEAHERAGRLASALVHAGVGRGDRVAVMARNDIEFLEASLAIAAAGANPVPINTRWRASEVAHVLSDSAAQIVVAHTEFVPTIETAGKQAGLELSIVEIAMPRELVAEAALDAALGEPTGRHRLLDEWIDQYPDPLGHLEGAIADSMGLIYSSGTTGAPKGVLRERMTPQQLLSIAGSTAQRMGLAPGGQMLVAGPLYHTSPNAVATLALRMGTNITVMPRWDSERFLQLVDERKIQQVKVVPTMLSRLLSLPSEVRARYDVSSLTHLIHSAAPCPPAVKREAVAWFGDAVWEFYGCTEAGTITWISATEWLQRPGSVGRAADGAAVTIADEHGTPLSPGQTGRVYVRGADYWPRFTYLSRGAPDTPVPDMLWVGDIGHLDDDGYLYLTGRDSEVMIRGGVNLYPVEIENAIMAIDGVEDAAVLGVPDRGDLGDAVAAYVVARPGHELDPQGIRDHVRKQLADYKIPQVVRVVDELPRDDSGKVYKRQLSASYAADRPNT